jgi:hypothetical protein
MAIVLADVLASIMAVVIASGLATEELIPFLTYHHPDCLLF